MPKYSFQCNQCGTDFTVNVSWQEKGDVACPKCGSKDKKQDYSSVGIMTGMGSDPGTACPGRTAGGICPSTGTPCGMKH
ncbi:MAG TPA: FmdB family zinc ribbon protein [Negativicutes bacterium]|nr:FmdB family zinc ribbon protein [Negativicutes bacterium]